MAKEVKEVKEAVEKEVVDTEVLKEDKEELVTVQLPLTREKQDDVFVGLNGQTWKIKRGEPVEVPKAVKEILDNSERMDRLALQRSMAKPKKF